MAGWCQTVMPYGNTRKNSSSPIPPIPLNHFGSRGDRTERNEGKKEGDFQSGIEREEEEEAIERQFAFFHLLFFFLLSLHTNTRPFVQFRE